MKPFTNLWPPYKSADELFEDYAHLVVVSEAQRPKLAQFLRESTSTTAEEKLSIESCKMLSQMAQKTLCLNKPKTPINAIIPIEEKPLSNPMADQQKAGQAVAKIQEIVQIAMPPEFIERTAKELLEEEAKVRDWVQEYKKFIGMCFMARPDCRLVPSYYVQRIQELHIARSAHYREFCKNVCGRELPLELIAGGVEARAEQWEAY